jgi:hypothetical protein
MNDILQTIERVRRATRNGDVLTICDELHKLLTSPLKGEEAQQKLSRAQIQKNYRERKKAKQ